MTYGLLKFMDRIYFPDENQLRKVILQKFHVNP